MPTTKKENLYFGLMMCVGMVICMTLYQVYTTGLIHTISLKGVLLLFILVFVIAFLLESFVVGPLAKKIVFSLPYDKSKKGLVILSLSFFMVTGMVLGMSLFGLGMAYVTNSLGHGSLLAHYVSMVGQNFLFAFPLQLILIGPLVRYLFVKFVQGKRVPETAG